MIDRHERLEGSAVDLLETTPDWLMLAMVVVLVAGWLSWFAITAYRLIIVS